jgi:hypothetical protein
MYSLRAYDTFNALTKHFEVEPNVFFDAQGQSDDISRS